MSIESLKSLFRPELAELAPYRVPPAPPAVKLDANESPWPLPPEARARLAAQLHTTELHRYPDGRATKLREALAWGLGGTPDEYVLGAGSDELISLLATAMSKPRSGATRPVVVFPEPTFVMYGMTSRAHGWEPVGVPLDDRWDLDAAAMKEALERLRPNVVYYATPNNPTGNCFARETMEMLIESFPDTLHVIDEAYGAYSEQSFASWCEEHAQCALMGTLSKVGFAGIRVGWVRLEEALAYELEKVRQPFNLNTVSQEIATLALTDLAPMLEEQITLVVAERQRLLARLGRYQALECFPSDANFLLVRCSTNASELADSLLEREVAVRRFASGDPRLLSCIRITIGTPEENDRLIAALDDILQ
ncbi:MAG TPA: histidinol-phosphate transaminase [Polyangiales bacterium]|nr:histidinol-phosphate transaminase [Polyangiales bacterium]